MILTRDGKEITAIYRQDGSEVEEVKDANGRLVYSAAREIVGDLPMRYSGRGKPLADYLISGNALQDGTPSADAPVDATGCGVRTGNVMPAGEQKTVVSNGVTFSSDGKGKYTINGTATAYASARFNLLSAFTTPISVSNGGQGTLSFFNTSADNNVTVIFYNGTTKVDDWKQMPIRRAATAYNTLGNKYIDNVVITVSSGATVDITITPEFTDDGVLPSEFEPYGFKLPPTVNGVEYPIYLGQVETTRRIKKLVLTGEESWFEFGAEYPSRFVIYAIADRRRGIAPICTHYIGSTATNYSGLSDGYISVSTAPSSNGRPRTTIRDDRFLTVADFKSYLAAQYANGTPVTVWYVLATPETAVVNEPLMKIGDYADTISAEQAGVTIPTVNGANVLDMASPVKPSEIYIKGKGIKPTDVNGQ